MNLLTSHVASAAEETALRVHIERCDRQAGRWYQVRCAAESIHSFLAPRFVTTLALIVVVTASVALAA